MFDTLNLTFREAKAHDDELLAHIVASGKPVTFAVLFGGMEPRWAVEALDRLIAAGSVRELPDGKLAAIGERKTGESGCRVQAGVQAKKLMSANA